MQPYADNYDIQNPAGQEEEIYSLHLTVEFRKGKLRNVLCRKI